MALSANSAPVNLRGVGDTFALQAYATADHFYAGALLEINWATGLVAPLGVAGAAAKVSFVGICAKEQDITESSTTKRIAILACHNKTIQMTVTGASADTDVGDSVYCTSDDPTTGTKTPAAAAVRIGRIYRHITSTTCEVLLEPPALAFLTGNRTTVAVTATGASQGNGAALLGELNLVSGADGTNTVVLPASPSPGYKLKVVNLGGSALIVAPGAGGTINGRSTASTISLGAHLSAEFEAYSTTAWAAITAAS